MNLKKIAETTVWNFHGTYLANVGFRKGSNLHKKLGELYKKGVRGMVTVYVEAIGRSQHASSRVGIYMGVTDAENFGPYYSSRHAEYKIDMFED